MLISLEKVSKVFADRLLFLNVSLKVEAGDRIGLVGVNGAGKTTLMRILAGELPYDSGERAVKSGLSVGYLEQNSGVDGTNTIYEEMKGVFSPLLEVQGRMRETVERMAAYTDHTDPSYLALQGTYAADETFFASNGGYDINVRIETVLCGMGFQGVDRGTVCGTLSGGEKTRLALAKLLLRDPDVLMLDEPTNHLDFDTLEWLEAYLQSFKGAIVVVSHDRYFLDCLCNRIWDVANLRVQAYKGNYTKYLQTRDMLYETQRKEYEAQKQEIEKLTDYVARNKVRASTSNMAKSREKQLERMELVEAPPPSPVAAHILFAYEMEPVKDVLHVEGLDLRVGDEAGSLTLCTAADFDLLRGEKVALVGPNGVGKSSFLKAIQGKLRVQGGRVRWGRNVRLAYYEQETLDLNPGKTVLAELWDRFPQTYEKDLRGVLGGLRFSGEDVYKRVAQLSGGEKARLKFAIMMYQKGNVLLLDEPTNHLDLPTKEALEAALAAYEGTVLMVSHDRYLLSHVPTRIVEMRREGFLSYPGGFPDYMSARKSQALSRAVQQPQKAESEAASAFFRGKRQRSEDAARRKRFKEAELALEALEADIRGQEALLQDPALAKDYVQLQEACGKLEEMRREQAALMEEWAALADEIEQ